MPLMGLTIHTPEEYQEAIKDKDPIKIRVAIFYDGTLNNRLNIEEREKRELSEQKRKELNVKYELKTDDYEEFTKDESNSYNNGRTNIAIMEPHVSRDKADYADYDFVYKHYIPGQGTITYLKDATKGYAFAIGESGVPDRAEAGINYAMNSILSDTDNINPQKVYIEKLTIDVFGFSRGAATARYAIHVIQEGRIAWIDENNNVHYEWDPVVNRLNAFNYVIKEEAVEIGFAGLYDTVLSYMGSQLLPWTANTLKQKAVAKAKKVLHLAAADEHRADFPLHKIKSAVNAGVGEEYYLPGVHSDIGGSYNQANEILLEDINTKEEDKVYMITTNEGSSDPISRNWWGKVTSNTMIINKGDPDTVTKDRQDLIGQGWYKDNEIRTEDVAWDDFGKPIQSILIVHRQSIHSSYCNIPLKIMAKYAREKGIELKIDPKLEDRADTILKSEKDLQELEKIIESYMASHKDNSTPEDWIGDKAELNNEKLKAIRHKHFHFSASKMSVGYKPNFEWNWSKWKFIRKRYYYNA